MKGFLASLPAIRAAGFEVELWCAKKDADVEADHTVHIPAWPNLYWINHQVFVILATLRAWWMFTALRHPRPDLIYALGWAYPFPDVCHLHFSQWDWAKHQRTLGVKSLSDLVHVVTNTIGLGLARLYLHAWPARRYITVSEAVATDLRQASPGIDVHVLPNSYNAERFHPRVREQFRATKRTSLGYSETDKVFLFASMGHYRRKGFSLAVDGVALLRKRYPSAKLLIVGGTAPAISRLKREVAARHTDWADWITFAGIVTDMEQYYAAADGLLFPSYSEAFALVEVEAAACGLPLFLTRHHGSEMIMQPEKNGLWLEHDAESIAHTLGDFVSGAWKPVPAPLTRALESHEYGERLVHELKQALSR
jgi:glycosyltransferase involved in cell wall biosynthesis